MAFILSDRVRETSTAPGTGSFTVNGPLPGAQSFASVLTSNGDTTWYAATNGTAWETGLLTRTSTTVYARTTIFASSNSGSAVNFASGTVDVFMDLPASRWATKADLASPSFTGIVTTAGQIAFPATQNASAGANTLDDYEEGTWTPGVSFGGGTTGITYAANGQVASYQKVGNRVHVQFWINLSSKGSSTGNALLTGLPFTTISTTNNLSSLMPMCFAMNTAVGGTLVSVNDTKVVLYAANSLTQLTDTAFQNGTGMAGSFTYQAAA